MQGIGTLLQASPFGGARRTTLTYCSLKSSNTKQKERKTPIYLTTHFHKRTTTSERRHKIIYNYAEKKTEKGLQMHLTTQFQTFPDRKQGICPQQTVLPTTLNIQFVEGKHTTYRGKTDALPSEKERTSLKREYQRSISTVNISIHNWLSTEYKKSLARMETNRPLVGKKRFSANRKYKVSKRQSPRRRKL